MTHTVNGGFYSAGALSLAPGTPLLLFADAREMLVAPALRPEEICARYRLASLERILVDGEAFQPRYVSLAKEPPRREEAVDRDAVSRLLLRFDGDELALDFRGAFGRHLAEVAARTLYDLRQLALPAPALKVIA